MSSLFHIEKRVSKIYWLFLSFLLVFSLVTPPDVYASPLYPASPKIKNAGVKGGYNGLKGKKRISRKPIVSKKQVASLALPVYRKAPMKKIPASVNAVHITINPGETKVVYLSREYINRIVFNHYVGYARTSKTGDVSITLNGKNAVVVFSPYMIESGAAKKIVYPKVPSSVLFKTGKSVVSLLLVPKNIPPQTVYINSIGTSSELPFHSGGGFSKYAAKIFKDIYAKRIPRGYMPKDENITYKSNYPQIRIKLFKKYKGGRFTVYEYLIKNLSNNEVSLSNKEFLYLRNNILAISLSEEHLFKNTYTRLLIMGD